MHILVVEDDFISRRLLCRYLEPFGECDIAVDGKEAVAAVSAALEAGNQYDLICLDIMMPKMGGQEALTVIRKLENDNGLSVGMGAKVVMTTALEDHENIRTAFSASADAYIVKPIDKPQFMKKLLDIGFEIPQTS